MTPLLFPEQRHFFLRWTLWVGGDRTNNRYLELIFICSMNKNRSVKILEPVKSLDHVMVSLYFMIIYIVHSH